MTDDGPGVIEVSIVDGSRVRVVGHGPARDWIMQHRRDILGMNDTFDTLTPKHEPVAHAQRKHGALRLGRSLCPYQELLMAVLGQRITAQEAAAQWGRLVRAHGESAPGEFGLMLPPRPEILADIPYFHLHRYGVERSRAQTLNRVGEAFSQGRYRPTDGDNSASMTASLRAIEGVGPWTAAVAGGTAFGDPDALRVGDFHIKNLVSWALRGQARGTDEEMVAVLEPYKGQRHRVVRWLQLDGWMAPKRGPRRRNVSIRTL